MQHQLLPFRFFLLTFVLFMLGHAFAQHDNNSNHDGNDSNDGSAVNGNNNGPSAAVIPPTLTSPPTIETTIGTPVAPSSLGSSAPIASDIRPVATATPSTAADGNLTYVKDSGICETTPGVHQVSGYISVSKDTHLWFWFFAARANPQNAPLTIWVSGQPGCSSMAGLFQEHGPCSVDSSGSNTTVNPYSWNTASSMLYVDLPAGAGFSYGPDSKDTFQGSAEQLWTALQMIFGSQEFAGLRTRRLIFATEGFGARLAPVLLQYTNNQNVRIDSHEITGYKVVFSAIMVNNGLHDPMTQMNSLIKFSTRAPGYGRVQNGTMVNRMKAYMGAVGSCGDFLQRCRQEGTSPTGNTICSNAWTTCESTVLQAAVGNRLMTDLTKLQTDPPYPSNGYLKYLGNSDVMAKIGATVAFEECNGGIKKAFELSGDLGRSSLPDLTELVNAKFPVLVWAGDLDIGENWVGVYNSIISMSWPGSQMLNSTYYRNITLSNQIVARAKVVNDLSFARIHGAGHAVAAYQPWVALQIFQEFAQRGTLLYLLDKPKYHPPVGRNGKNGSQGRWRRGGWVTVTVVSALGIMIVAVL